jgi:hypothetical protein
MALSETAKVSRWEQPLLDTGTFTVDFFERLAWNGLQIFQREELDSGKRTLTVCGAFYEARPGF